MGQRVIEALGIGTSATHMEWFYGPKGLQVLRDRLPARPASGAWDLYSAANDVDLYREWATRSSTARRSARCPGSTPPGIIALRPDQRRPRSPATPASTTIQRPLRRVDHRRAPARPPGTPTQPVEAGYMANAWVRLRHPDYDVAARDARRRRPHRSTVHAG